MVDKINIENYSELETVDDSIRKIIDESGISINNIIGLLEGIKMELLMGQMSIERSEEDED